MKLAPQADESSGGGDISGKDQIVFNFEALLINVTVDGVRESSGFSREIDPNIMRARPYPHRETAVVLLPAPDSDVMALRKGIRLLFKNQRRLLSINKERRHRTFVVRMVICNGKEGHRFGFQIEGFGRQPAGMQEGIHNGLLRAEKDKVDQV